MCTAGVNERHMCHVGRNGCVREWGERVNTSAFLWWALWPFVSWNRTGYRVRSKVSTADRGVLTDPVYRLTDCTYDLTHSRTTLYYELMAHCSAALA